MQVEYNFQSKIVVVTGALGQIGSELCNKFLDSNARVVALDIQSKSDAPTKENYLYIQTDITNKKNVQNTLKVINKKFNGDPSILINNAGIDSPPGSTIEDNPPPEDFDIKIWNKILDVNLTGSFITSQVYGKVMAKNLTGSIINISSIYGSLSPDNRIYKYKTENIESKDSFHKPIAYSVSKSGIYNLTRYFSTHWAKKGVRVNTVTLCGISNNQDEEFLEAFTKKIPMGRMAICDEAVKPICFLASDDASFITGADLLVDGGYSAW